MEAAVPKSKKCGAPDFALPGDKSPDTRDVKKSHGMACDPKKNRPLLWGNIVHYGFVTFSSGENSTE
jgi:hypothetical protein